MALKIPTPAPCSECGDGAIFHRLTYTTLLIDESIGWIVGISSEPTFKKPGAFERFVQGIERRVTPYILEALMKTPLATRVTAPDDETQLLAIMIWQEAQKRGIEVAEFRLGGLARNIFTAKLPNGRKIAFEGIPLPIADMDRVRWMDDKAVLKTAFRKLDIPVARGGAAMTLATALKIYRSLEAPVIVKPYLGSASRHTILHIDSEEKLARAFTIATQVAPRAVIEEELVGPVYRATVVDGKLAAVLRRDQPYVLGDGVHTVTELVADANMHPKRQGPYFHHIKLDAVADEELAWQGLTRDSVPEEGRRVTLHQKINWSVGGTTADVTDDVHPDNVALFEYVAQTLRATIAGIDFIIEDIAKSWKEQKRCGVLECNSMPFFDNHHLPFEGEPRDVAKAIWDMNYASYGLNSDEDSGAVAGR